jgi:hypothetical protein
MRTSIAAPATLALITALVFPAHMQQASGAEANSSAART